MAAKFPGKRRFLTVVLAVCVFLRVCAVAAPAAGQTANRPEVIRLEGTPEDIGRRHGIKLRDEIRLMLREYVGDDLEEPARRQKLIARVRAFKPELPDWYRKELSACAEAAGVDEDVLLYAQCEGDVKSLPGCTVYAAFGEATEGGKMEIGRNFDYWGLDSTEKCVRVFAVHPRKKDGLAFVSVGWTGILGGWTFYNEKGLFVGNILGGYAKKNPKGFPSLNFTDILPLSGVSNA
ncbi:MAG: C45 family autoproteolytic acyltransferase/hydrolase, partial [Candidatus Brocadiia bacterium]